jgi:hypothetical protein
MAGLVPAIHAFLTHAEKDVDARDKPGHDEKSMIVTVSAFSFALSL